MIEQPHYCPNSLQKIKLQTQFDHKDLSGLQLLNPEEEQVTIVAIKHQTRVIYGPFSQCCHYTTWSSDMELNTL